MNRPTSRVPTTPARRRLAAAALVASCLLLAGRGAAAWLPPPGGAPVEAAWPGRIPAADDRGFDVLHYALTLDFQALPPSTPHLAGVCRIELRLLDDPPAELRLDLVDQLAVGEVLWDGAPAVWTQAGDSLRVAMPAGRQGGGEHAVTIAYAGTPPRHGPYHAGLVMRRRGVTSPDDPADLGPTVGNMSQPYSSHSWFPCKDHPGDKATVSLSITAPDTLGVVATGRLLATTAVAENRRRWDWATDHPTAPHVVGLAISAFESWGEPCGGVPLEFHVFAELRAQAEAVLAPTCAMLLWLEERLGPYPYTGEKYAQAAFGWSGAIENQTVTLLGQTVLLLPVRTAQLFVVHELVHHWFGNSLTPAAWRDIWLSEGFARYFEALWLEHDEGPQSYLQYMDQLRSPTLFAGDGLLGDPDPVLPNRLVYDKGAWVLHMLRHELGDEIFFAALRAYAAEPSLVHGHTGRAAMTAVFSRVASRDLAPWLAPWLDTGAAPELAARWQARGGGRTRIEVVQTQDAPFFPLAVPLRVHAGAETIDLRVAMRERLAGVEVQAAAAVDSVRVDPDGRLLRRTATTPPPRLDLALARPNPAHDGADLAFWLDGAGRVAAAVYDARGRLVRREPLGVMPGTGPRAAGGQPHAWRWDGRDANGRPASAGVYWLELRSGADRAARRVVLVR